MIVVRFDSVFFQIFLRCGAQPCRDSPRPLSLMEPVGADNKGSDGHQHGAGVWAMGCLPQIPRGGPFLCSYLSFLGMVFRCF